jgi:hypothetical protein
MLDVLIRNQETGALPPAPEFGQDALWPPVTTAWWPLRWGLFEIKTEVTDIGAAEASEKLLPYLFVPLYENNFRPLYGNNPLLTENALNDDFLCSHCQIFA